MTTNLRLLAGAAAGAALAFSSCAYDPYYGGTAVGASYSTGYGSGSSSSIFVSTGDPRWGYDPYCRSYYDYHRRAYYDPYLYGYYPVGYRPSIIIGTPHPYGWREGRYCPPPRRVTNITITNYRDRERNYRNSDYAWSRQVRQSQPGRDGFRPPGGGSSDGRDRDRGGPSGSGQYRRDDDRGPSSSGFRTRDDDRTDRDPTRYNSPQLRGNQSRIQQPTESRSREQERAQRGPSRYNTPIQTQPHARPEFRGNQQRRVSPEQLREPQRARSSPPAENRKRGNREEADDREKKSDRARLRSLGEG